MTQPAPAPQRRSPDLWLRIRTEWEAGETRPDLALRYGVGESTIRDRIAREGWRRPDAPPADAYDPHEAMRAPVACAGDAYRRADQALRRGRLADAERALRIARGFERLLAGRGDLGEQLDAYWDRVEFSAGPDYAPTWPPGVVGEEDARLELAASRPSRLQA